MIPAPDAQRTPRLSPFTFHLSLFTLVLLSGCRVSLSPLKNRVSVGEESYVVFDGEGEDGQGDLYAGSASGGSVFRITFTRVHESSPALSPDGTMLAFIRGARAADSASHRIWIMNLLNGAEREMPVLGPAAYPRRLAWSLDGAAIYARTAQGDFRIPAPPAPATPEAVTAGTQATADTILAVPLGFPVIAIATGCDSGICAFTRSGSQVVSTEGRDPFRWGSDSLAYIRGRGIEVRPLAGGATREVRWTQVPSELRTATQFPGILPPRPDR